MIEASEIISEFAAYLEAEQERLGPEFERVLFDNLWELYSPAHEAPPSDLSPACPSPTPGAGGGT